MIRRIRSFIALSHNEKKLFIEAYLMLGIMRASILTVSFRRLTRSLQHHQNIKETQQLNEQQSKTATSIGKAITQAAAHTPWESACLAQSLTAQRMLQRRGIGGVFYLGVAKEEGVANMKAHAWSQCGGQIITGEAGCEAFRVISVFEWGRE